MTIAPIFAGVIANNKQLPVEDPSLWLNAEIASSVALSSAVVAGWDDVTAGRYSFTSPTLNERPTYNQFKFIGFDGTQGLQNTVINFVTESVTIFVALQRDGLALDYPIISIPINGFSVDVAVDLTSVIVSYTKPIGIGFSATVPELATGHFLLTIQLMNLNGSPTAVIRANAANKTVTGTLGRGVSSSVTRIGFRDVPLSQRFVGHIHEIAAYARLIDDTDRDAAEAFLIDKWNFA